MFVLIQLPVADLRPLLAGERGRLAKPDWSADDPGGAFMRGFGKVAARNSAAYGLIGERAFADFDNAVRFNYRDEHLWYAQKDWEHPVTIQPWFRRFYFDGIVAGRFEFGFLVMDNTEDYVFNETKAAPYDPSVLGGYLEGVPVMVHIADGRQVACRIRDLASSLAEAYVAATTSQKNLLQYPVAETTPLFVSVGPPSFQLRSTRFGPISVGRDHRSVKLPDGREIIITSIQGATRRNTLTIQQSRGEAMDEAPEERAVRVLFSHLNSLIYAISHFLHHEDGGLKGQLSRNDLRAAVDRMIARTAKFVPTAPEASNDEAFEKAITAFGRAYAGRVDELFAQLTEFAKSAHERTTGEKIMDYGKALFELGFTTAVQSATETAIKPT